MGNKKQKPTTLFNAASTRYCETCAIDVKVGFGGESNWETHTKSLNHARLVRLSTKQPSVSQFFTKVQTKSRILTPVASTSTVSTPSNEYPGCTAQPGPIAGTSTNTHAEIIDVDASSPSHRSEDLPPSTDVGSRGSSVAQTQLDPIQQLRSASSMLPTSVPNGTIDDDLARFSGDPSLEVGDLDPDEIWEYVNRETDRAFGYGLTAAALVPLLRRGVYGMDGLCNWFETCVRELGIDIVLLEGKIGRILEAIKLVTPAVVSEPTTAEPSNVLASPSGRLIAVRRKKKNSTVLCPGYKLPAPSGGTAVGIYPVAIHMNRTVPWTVSIIDTDIFLSSKQCSKEASHTAGGISPCSMCRLLDTNTDIMRIRHYGLDGAPETTPYGYLAPAQVIQSLRRKDTQIASLQTRAMNNLRSLTTRNRQIEGWKRFALAISKTDIPRLNSLTTAALRDGAGVYGLLERLDQAAQHVYSPKGYKKADFEWAFLMWKLGGRSAANIAYHTLGIPSIESARRHIRISPITASPGLPTTTEMDSNLTVCFAVKDAHRAIVGRVVGMTMPIDEIKIQERLRWDSHTNMILGVCREHGNACSLEFCTIVQADVLKEHLIKKTVHLASEATVIAACVLTDDPKEYIARPFVISGTCKKEDYLDQHKLLRLSSDALIRNQKHHGRRLYCIASDGDSRRRRASALITLTTSVGPTSPIFPILSPLRLFNVQCGDDEITMDFDWKHILKRFRNTLLRQHGITIDSTILNTPLIRRHLLDSGMSEKSATSLLAPNDKQDVVLMIQLLNSIAQLPPADQVGSRASQRILRLLGQLYRNILEAFLETTLSLHEQLTRLSTTAHLVLALYASYRGDFIPIQLFFDVMSMIKNAFMCVAKTQVDDPAGQFWLILLGTDALEEVFGKVRTMVGNDTNADQLQLANRIDGACECARILAAHSDWGGDSRRLKLKSLQEQGQEISKKLDHIKPRSWRGDVFVKNLILRTSWEEGRRIADTVLTDASLPSPFATMEAGAGYDILCPFGSGKMVMINGVIEHGEAEETPEEQDQVPDQVPAPSPIDTPDITDPAIPLPGQFPDLDDLAAAEDTTDKRKYEAWIPIDINPDAPIIRKHKSTILSDCANPSDSKDRLKRVRGYTQYHENTERVLTDYSTQAGGPYLEIQDPILILVSSNGLIFAAVAQVIDIRISGISTDKIQTSIIGEPNIRLRAQILKLKMIDAAHQPLAVDWEWDGTFESTGNALREIEGSWVEALDPAFHKSSTDDAFTYAFKTEELRALAAVLYERIISHIRRMPVVKPSNTFPYRTATGSACFVCEKTTTMRDPQGNDQRCGLCPDAHVLQLSGPELLQHMGAHVLHDPRLKDADNPCGLCLNQGNLCGIRLVKHGKSGDQVDLGNSRCRNLYKISLKYAAKFSKKTPCTNVPLRCPLCPKVSDAIWKYNLRAHISKVHAGSDVSLYSKHFTVEEGELVLMKAAYLAKPRKPKKVAQRMLTISEAHSSRITFRATSPVDTSDYDSDDSMHTSSSHTDTSCNSDGESHVSGSQLVDEPLISPELPCLHQSVSPPCLPMAPPISPTFPLPPGTEDNPNTSTESDSVPIDCTIVTAASASDLPEPVTPPIGSRRPRRRKVISPMRGPEVIQCSDCELSMEGNESVMCDGPGCNQYFHLACRGLLEKPVGGWFCDDVCRESAGFRVWKRRKNE